MSAVARLLLSWTAISVVASPLVGALLHRRQIDLAPAPTVRPAVPVR